MTQKTHNTSVKSIKERIITALRSKSNLTAREIAISMDDSADVVRWHLRELLNDNKVSRRYRAGYSHGKTYEYQVVSQHQKKPPEIITAVDTKWAFPVDKSRPSKPVVNAGADVKKHVSDVAPAGDEVVVLLPIGTRVIQVSIEEAASIFNKLKPIFNR